MWMDSIKSFLLAMHAHGVKYTLVGGIALNLHGISRNTLDIDILVPEDSANLEKLKQAMDSVFHDPSIQEISAADLTDYAVVRYGSPEGFYVDIILRLGEMFHFNNIETRRLDWEGVPVSIASPFALFCMKKGTLRPQDQADAVRLQERFHFAAE